VRSISRPSQAVLQGQSVIVSTTIILYAASAAGRRAPADALLTPYYNCLVAATVARAADDRYRNASNGSPIGPDSYAFGPVQWQQKLAQNVSITSDQPNTKSYSNPNPNSNRTTKTAHNTLVRIQLNKEWTKK